MSPVSLEDIKSHTKRTNGGSGEDREHCLEACRYRSQGWLGLQVATLVDGDKYPKSTARRKFLNRGGNDVSGITGYTGKKSNGG